MPDRWPDINSHFGIIDEAGFPKDRYFWYQAWLPQYADGDGMVHLIPRHWNWPMGASVDVWAFSNAASIELFVNGVSAGRVHQSRFSHAEWRNVSFATGELRAVAYSSSGAVIAHEIIETTGPVGLLPQSSPSGARAARVPPAFPWVAMTWRWCRWRSRMPTAGSSRGMLTR